MSKLTLTASLISSYLCFSQKQPFLPTSKNYTLKDINYKKRDKYHNYQEFTNYNFQKNIFHKTISPASKLNSKPFPDNHHRDSKPTNYTAHHYKTSSENLLRNKILYDNSYNKDSKIGDLNKQNHETKPASPPLKLSTQKKLPLNKFTKLAVIFILSLLPVLIVIIFCADNKLLQNKNKLKHCKSKTLI